jgi:hypothetical protein
MSVRFWWEQTFDSESREASLHTGRFTPRSRLSPKLALKDRHQDRLSEGDVDQNVANYLSAEFH